MGFQLFTHLISRETGVARNSGYNTGITPSSSKPRDYLLAISTGVILLVVAWLGFWSNHFQNSFHFDDFPTIVRNPYLAHLSNFGHFFTDPRTFSAEKETADYRPLLSAWFALDYKLGGGAKAFIFQSENFAWFTLQLAFVCLLFRFIPGGNWFSAVFGTFLYGLHPVLSDTINYPLQRGTIMGAFSVITGLWLWIFWPRHLPQKLPLKLKRVPQHGFDEFLRHNFARMEATYLRMIHLPVALYLWPVALGLLVDPATAVFAPILAVYIFLFETERRPRHALPAIILCGTYWIFQTLFTWRFGTFSRLPVWNYWITQPWVALRYLADFVAPVHLSADSDLKPFAHFWSPLAIAGYAGVAALVVLGVYLSRKDEWRPVAFGLWWFLIALIPSAAVPSRVAEADWRMYLPFVGLTLALSRAAWIGFAILLGSGARSAALVGFPVLAVALLALCGWGANRRNLVWQTEATLWSDVTAKSPANGRALMYLGLARMEDDPELGLNYVIRAADVARHDPVIEINLARGYNQRSRSADAEAAFRNALKDGPSYSPSYSWYGQWLQSQERNPEATAMANKALSLDPYDLTARRTMIDLVTVDHRWEDLKKLSEQTLRLYPEDPDGQRARQVAQNGLDSVAPAEDKAKDSPTVDHYLNLSVLYYNSQRYEDCIHAAQEALKINPNLGEAWSNIAAAYHTLGKTDETLAALREEIRINPNLPSATHNLEVVMAEKARQKK